MTEKLTPLSLTLPPMGEGICHATRSEQNRVQDLLIPRAAAEVAGERLANLVSRRFGVVVQQRLRCEQDAGRAVAALRGAELSESLLQRVELRPARKPLDGRDRAAFDLDRQQQAAQLRPSVHEDTACPAFAQLAAVLGAGQLHVLAQHLEKGLVHRQQQLGPLAIYVQCNDLPIDGALYLVSQLASSIVRRASAHAHRSGATACAWLDAGTGSSGWTRIAHIPSLSAGSMSFSSRLPITTHCSGWTPAHRIAISKTAG